MRCVGFLERRRRIFHLLGGVCVMHFTGVFRRNSFQGIYLRTGLDGRECD